MATNRPESHTLKTEHGAPVSQSAGVCTELAKDGYVPGGFGKIFRRLVTSGIWARLSDRARSIYVPLIVFAVQTEDFSVKIGMGELSKHAGISKPTAAAAMKELVEWQLVEILSVGKWSPQSGWGKNRYRLRVPLDTVKLGPKDKNRRKQVSEPSKGAFTSLGKTSLLPSKSHFDEGRESLTAEANKGGLPLSIRIGIENSSKSDAAALLRENGVDGIAARALASAYPIDRIVDAIDAMKYRRSRGRCDNPGGLIHDFLVRNWKVPGPIIKLRQEEARRQAIEERARLEASNHRRNILAIDDEDLRLQRLVESLPDDELEDLAKSVLKKYEGNAAVLSTLTKKPARQCRLMKMEIAAILGRV